jgi:hypothetical protein
MTEGYGWRPARLAAAAVDRLRGPHDADGAGVTAPDAGAEPLAPGDPLADGLTLGVAVALGTGVGVGIGTSAPFRPSSRPLRRMSTNTATVPATNNFETRSSM